jgi:hypothetical protein
MHRSVRSAMNPTIKIDQSILNTSLRLRSARHDFGQHAHQVRNVGDRTSLSRLLMM